MASIKRIGKDQFDIPIWEVVYRRTPGGKQIRRRLHLISKAEVERTILMDSQRSGIGITWSEGAKIYLDAKIGNCGPRSLESFERAVDVFKGIVGDIQIESTTEEVFKNFMQDVVTKPLWNEAVKKKKVSGPKVANEHRRKLITIAKYLKNYTTKIKTIPFENVLPLPAREREREPIPRNQVGEYMDALPAHVWRPVCMVLYYGLRSSADCALTNASIQGGHLNALDKGDVKRRIPIDDFLEMILRDAAAFKTELVEASRIKAEAKPGVKIIVPADNLFVNLKGRPWTRKTLLDNAQKAWKKEGLTPKLIHEVRHTLGTLAGKYFSKGMVQAAMGHRSEKSSGRYFHPDEEMAAEVRQKIITELSQPSPETPENTPNLPEVMYTKPGEYHCPHCHHKFLITKEKGRKP